MKKVMMALVGVLTILCALTPVHARSLKSQLKNTLFAASPDQSLFLTVPGPLGRQVPVFSANPQRFGQLIQSGGANGIARFFTRGLSNEILTESVTVPVPSGSPSFVYVYNTSLNVFEREAIGLGSIFNERVNTLGKGLFAVGVAYIRQDFDEFNGKDLSNLYITKGLFARQTSLGEFLDPGLVKASVDLDISTSTVALYGIYGLTDWLDVSLLLPITEISLKAQSVIDRGLPTLQKDLPVFRPNSQCTTDNPNQCRPADFTILRKGTPFVFGSGQPVRNTVDRTRAGIGDLILRSKARFIDGSWGALGGLTEFTVPTGQEDNFLGDGAFKARFLFLYSKGFLENHLNFHLNGGGKVTTQTSLKNALEYGSTVDLMVTPQLSLIAEMIGSWRVDSGGLPDNFIDGAFGFKANPFAGLIIQASFRIPATNDGLRSDLTYLAGLEYDF